MRAACQRATAQKLAEGYPVVVAGDLNAREGEDHCMCAEGWRDVLRLAPSADRAHMAPWTWCRDSRSGGYDRVYVHERACD